MSGSKKWDYPPYPLPFELTAAYDLGWGIAENIAEEIEGGPGCANEDAALLAELTYRAGHSDHLELGTLFGATAILVVLAKKKFGFDGDVYCIDNFTYQPPGFKSSPDVVKRNAEIFGVGHRIHIIEANTWPLPPPVNGMEFGSAYIDAAHDYGPCMRDWTSVKKVSRMVALHDYDMAHMGVVSTVRNAMQEPFWWLVYLHHHTAILERLE